jgi:hypothetical protein
MKPARKHNHFFAANLAKQQLPAVPFYGAYGEMGNVSVFNLLLYIHFIH